jgi:dihydrolipoamide dehydrogenase
VAEQFDVVIIGGGPGGYAAALYGASAELNVAMIEMDKTGGTCLNRGCIPAKELLETATVFRQVSGSEEFGVHSGEPTVDYAASMARKQKVVDGLVKGLTGLLKARKVTTFAGVGTFGGGGQVTVTHPDGATTELQGDSVILASGSVPRTIPGFEVDGKFVLTSDEITQDMTDLPKSAAVIGGGAIGCEFASMMADLGVQVTILEGLPKIRPGCDADVANVVLRSFKKRKLDVRTGVKVTGHTPGESTTTLHIDGGDDLEVERVIVSVGRRPLSENLELDGTGVEVDDRGFVKVDGNCRTTLDGVWAVGDLIATPQLAHIAFIEGINAIKDILGEGPAPVQYDKVPWCIYCHPEVSFVGHSEESAREAGYDVVVSKHQYRGNGRALILGETDGLVKVIAEKQADGSAGQILGVHMVGPWVTEQLGQAYLTVNWEATVDEVAELIQPHPTLSELYGETVLSLTGRSLHG